MLWRQFWRKSRPRWKSWSLFPDVTIWKQFWIIWENPSILVNCKIIKLTIEIFFNLHQINRMEAFELMAELQGFLFYLGWHSLCLQTWPICSFAFCQHWKIHIDGWWELTEVTTCRSKQCKFTKNAVEALVKRNRLSAFPLMCTGHHSSSSSSLHQLTVVFWLLPQFIVQTGCF